MWGTYVFFSFSLSLFSFLGIFILSFSLIPFCLFSVFLFFFFFVRVYGNIIFPAPVKKSTFFWSIGEVDSTSICGRKFSLNFRSNCVFVPTLKWELNRQSNFLTFTVRSNDLLFRTGVYFDQFGMESKIHNFEVTEWYDAPNLSGCFGKYGLWKYHWKKNK